jgi:O-acetyl-ADP-ribose deacetylase (regulator of RNase III)/ADP-ribose pyrophosphatase YjhB (NUDIX family)
MEIKSFFIGGSVIIIKHGDITEEQTDAIVNAANNRMIMGGGVARAIRIKGGKEIEEEARAKAPVRVGEAVTTSGGKIPSKFVIHAATMEMDFRTDEKIVRKSAQNALLEAEKLEINSIAFPALGCGTGRLKVKEIASVMAEEALRCFSKKSTLKEIRFVLYGKKDFEDFCRGAEEYFKALTCKTYRNPVPTVDIIMEKDDGIVLVRRKNYPYGWAIPGGFVDYGESLEKAAMREAKEEPGLNAAGLKQFHTSSEPGRDPRHHTISTVFTARGEGILKAADDAADARIFTEANLPEEFAFDHKEIIRAFYRTKSKLS